MSNLPRRTWRITAILLASSMALAACGSDEDEPSVTGDTTGTTAPAGNIVKIGLISPLSGDLSALGLGIKNGADLAIKSANAANKVPGWTIQLAAEDDTAKADVGATVAAKLASDDRVIAVIGTLNSSVAQQVQPILDKAGIAMVSPANTNPTLTQGEDPKAKKRAYQSYFRVSTTDDIQGPFAADYATKTLKAKSVVIVHDKKTYGQGLSDAFKKRFAANGGKVLGTETVNPGDKDFSAVVSKIKQLKPAMVYYGGEYPEASLLSSQAKQGGVKVPLMGGDGIYSAKFIETAKTDGIGDLATSVGAPVDQLDSAKDFIKAYDEAGYKDPYDAYGAYSYDAANVIIEALAKALAGAEAIDAAVRTKVVEGIQATKLQGVTGEVAFDEFGDTTTKVLTVYEVVAAAECPKPTSGTTAAPAPCWKPVQTDAFA